jgi:Zierdtviridae DNA primase
VTNVVHTNPYRNSADKYYKKFWKGTLPLPYKAKEAPPTGFTGHAARYPMPEEIVEWASGSVKKNICIRLAGVSKEYEIVGIDVDHYKSGDKDKRGGDQLEALEEKLGKLPDTWIATSRIDGKSGIRFFLVKRGFVFRGQVDKDIECISKGYRYAVVWPSLHPLGKTYWWYPPGFAPIEENRSAWSEGEIPDARHLPLLPEKWVEYITQNKMSAEEYERIDMDSSVDEIYKWAEATFHSGAMCEHMGEKLENHKAKIKNEATSHDKIVNAHMNIILLAQEGHLGWKEAINEINNFWGNDVIERDKRGFDELKGEIWRSYTNALRKVKAKCDERIKIGAAPIDTRCDQLSSGPPNDPVNNVPQQNGRPADHYTSDDRGNANHLYDFFGHSVRFVDGLGWMIWLGDRWEIDPNGDNLMQRLWHKIHDRQICWLKLFQKYYENVLANIGQGVATTGANAPLPLIKAREKFKTWSGFIRDNGNAGRYERMLKKLKSFPDVQIDIKQVNAQRTLLAVANGILDLTGDKVKLIDPKPEYLITYNTGVSWEEPSEFAKILWQEYLDTFIPNKELQKVVQVLLGYGLTGFKEDKYFISLKGRPETGKSTMISAILVAMRDYATTVDYSMFQSENHFNEDLVAALDKRYAFCSEAGDEEKVSAPLLKRIVGGHDEIGGRIKFSMARKVDVPQFMCVFAMNEFFQIIGLDKATKNRMKTIPFDTVPDRLDRTKTTKLLSICGPVVLDWLIKGYEEFKRNGIPQSNLIEEANKEAVAESNIFELFGQIALEKHDHFGKKDIRWQDIPGWCVRPSKLYERFEMWWVDSREQDRERPSQNVLTRRLKALGYEQRQLKLDGVTDNYWIGVRIVSKAHQKVIELPTTTKSATPKTPGQDI